jgi:hypothetical protein
MGLFLGILEIWVSEMVIVAYVGADGGGTGTSSRFLAGVSWFWLL